MSIERYLAGYLEIKMEAIILAAGRGSRLGAITAEAPKPLTKLVGKPLIEWQISALTTANVGPITIVTGYCDEKLQAYGDRHSHNPLWSSSNMVRSLMAAATYLNKAPQIVSYGDIAYRADTITKLMTASGDIAITYDTQWLQLWQARFDDPLSDAETFIQKNGKLLTIGGKTEQLAEIQGQYMGLLYFTPRGWQRVERYLNTLSDELLNKLDMTGLLNALLAQDVDIDVVAIDGGWVEVDNPEDIDFYETQILEPSWSHDWRG